MRRILIGLMLLTTTMLHAETPWTRHTIDDSSRGADGVRLADVNGDRLPDILTPWAVPGRCRSSTSPATLYLRSLGTSESWWAVMMPLASRVFRKNASG